MKPVVYVGPYPEVETDFGIARRGQRFDVPAEAAGRPPAGNPWDVDKAGPSVYDPGEGLLAQPGNWQPWPLRQAKEPAAEKAASPRRSRKPAKPAAGSDRPAASEQTKTEEG